MRKLMRRKVDRKVFKRTANRVASANLYGYTARGGYHL